MSAVEESLTTWATTATGEQLDSGPTFADLGGIELVLAEAETLACSPHLPALLQAAAHPDSRATREQLGHVVAAVERGFRRPHAAWVLAEAIDTLYEQPDLLELCGGRVAPVIARHAEDALSGGQDPAYAHPAVAGLLQLSIAGHTNHRRLLLMLTEITGDEPLNALERLPLLIGVAHDHYNDSGLLDVLQRLEDLDDLPQAARNDARYELAVATLRAGLHAHDQDEVLRLLRDAALRLQFVADAEEGRLDARALGCALDAVFAFTGLDLTTPNPYHGDSARSRLTEIAQDLGSALAQRTAWASRMHQPRWLEARGLAEAAWAHLVAILNTTAPHLLEVSWYNASHVLTNILDIYQASRAVYTHPQGDNGLGTIVSPPIEAAFIRESGLLKHLHDALRTDPHITNHPDVGRLAAAVETRRQALESGAAAEPPGKFGAGQPRLASLLTLADPSPDLLAALTQVIDDYERGYALTGNVLLDRQLEDLYNRLARSSGWTRPASAYFSSLLSHFLRFMHNRFDAQPDQLGELTAYLGPHPEGERWLEKAVQDDCLQHLKQVLPPGTVRREEIDTASGRTDITYTPEPGMRFVIEVKRHLNNWTRNSIEKKYIAQAANYTATGPPFGILLVGDHSDHKSGYPDLADSVWTAQRSRSPTETPRLIVVGVLPIARPSPSDLRST
ncbi:hypothetical protein O7627_33595 [Solwaraspora sp. WMMD1047]|uniref:hypothetical protein n=1 Tax=Solwaraspora sp. WMMD1047 TaxID=3016102 RepID=UPI002417DF6B|nr:hypothetical protein [Solwaraspora sp. WMMD1047]MDG4834201.1 hypothetical protein [Solwaraspora sp. WMMD1047]